jgi:hypothetical protein
MTRDKIDGSYNKLVVYSSFFLHDCVFDLMIYIPAYSLSFFNTRRSCLLPRLAQKETTALGPVQQLNLLPHIKKTYVIDGV